MLRGVPVVLVGLFFVILAIRAPAQSLSLLAPAAADAMKSGAGTNAAPAASSPTHVASSAATAPKTQPVDAAAGESAAMPVGDFVINGISYARVLYIEGNVWVRPPNKMGFHL